MIILSGHHNILYSQKVCGAEILKVNYFPVEHRLRVDIYVCREHNSKDSIFFDWGDGYIDTLSKYASGMADANHVIDLYGGIHFYDTTINEYVLLSILDEEVEEGFENIDYTANTSFILTDSVLIYNVESIPGNATVNEGPIDPSGGGILGTQNYGYPSPEILLYMYDGSILGLGDSLIYDIGDFPVEGYTHPAPTDEFYMDGGLMIWNTPMVAGKYAVACKIREMANATNPIYEGNRVLFSTITRAFTIIVDSNDIVSTLGINTDIGVLSIYPNPAQNILNIEYGGLIGSLQLQVTNMQGQLMHEEILESFTQLQSQKIDVRQWPVGMYVVELSGAQGRAVKKVLVEAE